LGKAANRRSWDLGLRLRRLCLPSEAERIFGHLGFHGCVNGGRAPEPALVQHQWTSSSSETAAIDGGQSTEERRLRGPVRPKADGNPPLIGCETDRRSHPARANGADAKARAISTRPPSGRRRGYAPCHLARFRQARWRCGARRRPARTAVVLPMRARPRGR